MGNRRRGRRGRKGGQRAAAIRRLHSGQDMAAALSSDRMKGILGSHHARADLPKMHNSHAAMLAWRALQSYCGGKVPVFFGAGKSIRFESRLEPNKSPTTPAFVELRPPANCPL